MITTLIDKQDNFEIIRDKIVDILVIEIANQQVLATGAGKDPELWRMDIYKERSNAFEKWLNDTTDTVPICNVWVDSGSSDEGASNVTSRQKVQTIYNLDCYGYGESKTDGGSGHIAGDELAAKEVQRAYRLVRNILMSSIYTYLELRPYVGKRFPQSYRLFQPEYNGQAIQNIMGLRFALLVDHEETSPQYDGDVLEYVSVTVEDDDGKVILEQDFDYTV